MFTGIIQTTGVVKQKKKDGIVIEAPTEVLSELKIGSSIAVDGACLTVTKKTEDTFSADVMPVTFEKTALGKRKKGSLVNLEPAMKNGDRFDGHFVSGHIEGTGKLIKQKIDGNAYLLTFEVPEHLMRYVIKEGSIALNGISLTVADIEENHIQVSVIPHTWDNTNLHEIEINDKINIETDLLSKYAEKLLATRKT